MNEQNTKGGLKALAIIALMLITLGSMSTFLTYKTNYVTYEIYLTLDFPSFLGLLYFSAKDAASILLLLYVFSCASGKENKCFLPIIYGCLSFLALLGIYEYIQYDLSINAQFIVDIFLMIIFALALGFSCGGIKMKPFHFVAIGFGFLGTLIDLLTWKTVLSFYLDASMGLFFFTKLATILGFTVFYIALLVIVIKYKRSHASLEDFYALGDLAPKTVPKELTPEEELRFLKEKLSRGMISEQEYQEKRIEVLKRL